MQLTEATEQKGVQTDEYVFDSLYQHKDPTYDQLLCIGTPTAYPHGLKEVVTAFGNTQRIMPWPQEAPLIQFQFYKTIKEIVRAFIDYKNYNTALQPSIVTNLQYIVSILMPTKEPGEFWKASANMANTAYHYTANTWVKTHPSRCEFTIDDGRKYTNSKGSTKLTDSVHRFAATHACRPHLSLEKIPDEPRSYNIYYTTNRADKNKTTISTVLSPEMMDIVVQPAKVKELAPFLYTWPPFSTCKLPAKLPEKEPRNLLAVIFLQREIYQWSQKLCTYLLRKYNTPALAEMRSAMQRFNTYDHILEINMILENPADATTATTARPFSTVEALKFILNAHNIPTTTMNMYTDAYLYFNREWIQELLMDVIHSATINVDRSVLDTTWLM
jgi:hypothetical protein